MNSEGGARIISLSSNRQMAAAMGIHTELAAAHPDWNVEAMYYAKKQVRLFSFIIQRYSLFILLYSIGISRFIFW